MLRPFALSLLLSTQTAHAEPPTVVADIPAVGSLAQAVMGDLATVRVLLPQGGNAHSYQLRPSEARAVQEADLLIWIGPELTPWLARAAENLSAEAELPLLALPETHRRAFNDGHDEAQGDHATAHDHSGHNHAAHEHEEAEADSHEHDGADPHAWLDPRNGQIWLGAIADALSEQDPENEALYRANADRAADTITQAETRIAARLAPHRDARIAVSHDAYGYFTDHFGLPAAVTLSLGDAASPSAARLAEFRDRVRREKVRCIFPEAQHDPALIASALEGTGATLAAPLDPSGSAHAGSADLYVQILTDMGTTMADCLDQPAN